MKPSVSRTPFGRLADGRPISEFSLDNGAGMVVGVLDYGCIIRRWTLATRDAQELYRKFGFEMPRNPQNLMEITRPGLYLRQPKE